MRAFTIKAAKAHLNELVEIAEAGEQVILMRGAKHVAAIVPIDESQLELAIDLTDVQAARLWRQLASEQKSGGTAVFGSAARAVQHLSKPGSARRQRQSRV
jgi:prevent-host-death family protein